MNDKHPLEKYVFQLFIASFENVEFGFEEKGSFIVMNGLKIWYGFQEYEGETEFPMTFGMVSQEFDSVTSELLLNIATRQLPHGTRLLEIDEDGHAFENFVVHQFFTRNLNIDIKLMQACLQEFFFYTDENLK